MWSTVWIAQNVRPYLSALYGQGEVKEKEKYEEKKIIKAITNRGLFACPQAGNGSDVRHFQQSVL